MNVYTPQSLTARSMDSVCRVHVSDGVLSVVIWDSPTPRDDISDELFVFVSGLDVAALAEVRSALSRLGFRQGLRPVPKFVRDTPP